MAMIALALTAIAGWLGWSGWLAIPIGLFAFIGARRSLPGEAERINRVGIPVYIIGTFLIMKLVGWIHGLV
ncbi:hypothetical protein [Sphingomonas sp.]|uniref:hypothetical protein n=1 Tax=Sphingomonas sp. TaxID=28214 RepID=UPI003CC5ABA2